VVSDSKKYSSPIKGIGITKAFDYNIKKFIAKEKSTAHVLLAISKILIVFMT